MHTSARTRVALLLLLLSIVHGFVSPTAVRADEAEADQPAASDQEFAADQIEFFEKKVRPILIARCYECHSAESSEAKGGLRLDSRAFALEGGDTGPAVVAGNAEESLLIDAVDENEYYSMPPKGRLPDEEIEILKKWVSIGAPWPKEAAAVAKNAGEDEFNLAERAKHWAFQPIQDPAIPDVRATDWPTSPIDHFILSKLEEQGLSPASPVEKRALLRRVTFDLIGLPPTPEEIEAFLADDSTDAYSRVVERLLASPHYGERWGRHWLDLVRYAETTGHEFDRDIPNAYRYRDYVIRAFNDDVPYNQFVIEHLAGDLLPQPRIGSDNVNESLVATGFYFLGEAMHSPVDVRKDEADRIDNQIDVLSKTFLGLTVACARCHDHKFDAITTKDYYALAGFLQSSRYQQGFIDHPGTNEASTLEALQSLQDAQRTELQSFARSELVPRLDQVATNLLHGEMSPEQQEPGHPLFAWQTLGNLTGAEFQSRRDELLRKWAGQRTPETTQQRVLADFSSGTFGEWVTTGEAFGGRPAMPNDVLTTADPSSAPLPMELFGRAAAHSGLKSVRLRGTLRSPTFTIEANRIAYLVAGQGAEVRLVLDGLQLIQDPIYGGLAFTVNDNTFRWHERDLSKWIGHRAYIEILDHGDGYAALERVVMSNDGPQQEPVNPLIVQMVSDPLIDSADKLATAYVQLWNTAMQTWCDESANSASTFDAARLTAVLLSKPELLGLDVAVVDKLRVATAKIAEQKAAHEAKLISPRQAVAITDGTPENERVFIRGNHKTLGEEVPRRLLEVLDPRPVTQGSGRLELAKRMTDPTNPLVARVMVNRIWKHHFGQGIVRTPDDFGTMGQLPTHPELLDFLATRFVRDGWSIKNMHRMMVLSSTYQMSSRAEAASAEKDPENKLLHRMPMRRLEAEAIRDAMLAISGRLDRTMYGESVMPHLTQFMVGRGRPSNSGPLDSNGRRSIYIQVRRNFLMPMLLAFDFPQPATTIGRRSVSNVPAQALTLMNNPLVIEQARLWAELVMQDANVQPADRIRRMYVQAYGRAPDADELAAALQFVDSQLQGATTPVDAWADLAHTLFTSKEFIFVP